MRLTNWTMVAGLMVAAVPPASAQSGPGYAGSTVGVPANPFASNYPSAPPSRFDEPDGYEDVGPRRGRRARRPVRVERRGLVPPADIPGR